MKKVLTIGLDEHEAEPYLKAMRDAGVEPVLADPDQTPSLDGFAGLLLMGGCDVDPQIYGADPEPETQQPDPARDQAELRLIHEALQRDLPLLAICRGVQMLNAAEGGTLIQHLPTHRRHVRRTADKSLPAHEVDIEPGTKLSAIANGARKWAVNSRHHQAVNQLAPGYQVCAVDPEDGTIEAIERPDRRFVVGVQWHPENQAPVNEQQAGLFRAFADACGA